MGFPLIHISKLSQNATVQVYKSLKKKISHVSSTPAAPRGFLFAIKLFLILTVLLLFARKIIILSRGLAISLLSHVLSDGLNKYP